MAQPIPSATLFRIMDTAPRREGLLAKQVELRAAAPIRARCDQADMADTPLFGTRSLI